jgi:uncharacterized protein
MSVPSRASLTRMPAIALIPVALVASYVAQVLVWALWSLFGPDTPLGGPAFHLQGIGFVAALLVACVIAPLTETLAFQWAIIAGLRRFTRCPAGWAIGVSAVCFGLVHVSYSVEYALRAAASGLVLGTVFVIEQDRRGAPFWVVTAIHALHNLIATFALSQLV